jgi:hypothetical protein
VDLYAVKALLPFNNETEVNNKRKLISDYYHEKILLPPGITTPQPSDSESEDTVAELPLRKRTCSQLSTGDYQLHQVRS